MKCVNCMGPEEYTNGLCFQCYLKTVPPGKVIEYNPKEHDPVSHPSHYTQGGIETIDFLEAKLGDGFEDYCVGNILKYMTRYKHKNGLEDLKKAAWYLEKVITWKAQHEFVERLEKKQSEKL